MMQYERFGRTELSMPVFSCDWDALSVEVAGYAPRWLIPPRKSTKSGYDRGAQEVINHITETAHWLWYFELQLGRILPGCTIASWSD